MDVTVGGLGEEGSGRGMNARAGAAGELAERLDSVAERRQGGPAPACLRGGGISRRRPRWMTNADREMSLSGAPPRVGGGI